MTPKVYINGKLFDKPDAKISVYDHGLLYGDGVFEGIRIYNGKAFKLKEHVERLFDSARAIKLEVPMSREQMIEAINHTIAVNQKKDGYIRPLVTRGAGYLGLDPRKTSDPQVIIIVDDITLYPPELYENGMDIATVATIRNHPAALNPRIKSLNYLNNILAKIEGILCGCAEVLMLNHKGEIAECSGDNIFLVKHGVLKTPSIDAGILEGITRNTVIELARKTGIPVQELALIRHDVFTADECFLTGTAAEIIPVVKCDARSIGTGKPGPITKQLSEAYRRLIRE
ncbi:MAG: branched-chain-amino-acid transaminase [Gemmataceae bacterium]|nr:branched-chain-amino-acid transaminase [Gemmataceae bacterium]MCI0738817.1 branched-chain-amino-acid transaminase [Gemmataceae bacterium]